MDALGLSNKDLSEMVDQSEANVSRMLTQDVRRIGYLDELRDVLSLPEDELETLFKTHAEELQSILARVMATDATIADNFLEDVTYLAAFYREVHRIRENIIIAEANARTAATSEEKEKAMAAFKALKKAEAELAKKRRQLTAILS